MNAQHVAVPLDTNTFLMLADFLRQKGDPRDPTEVVERAIEYFLENAEWKSELVVPAKPETAGFIWKKVFLPNGTKLRMKYRGEAHHAEVIGDKIIYDGEHVRSPKQFTERVTNTSRNAWNDLHALMPGKNSWVPANDLRRLN